MQRPRHEPQAVCTAKLCPFRDQLGRVVLCEQGGVVQQVVIARGADPTLQPASSRM
jgi:hypothetical protein